MFNWLINNLELNDWLCKIHFAKYNAKPNETKYNAAILFSATISKAIVEIKEVREQKTVYRTQVLLKTNVWPKSATTT